MKAEHHLPFLIHDPFIREANLINTSQGHIHTDAVLKSYIQNLAQWSPPDSLIYAHTIWLKELFPEVRDAARVPSPWTAEDIAIPAANVGGTAAATMKSQESYEQGKAVAYWTGGLEFTRNHHAVAQYLLQQNFYVLLGIEPFGYPHEFSKPRCALADHMVPVSFWSKTLGEQGFVFQIPRPLPHDAQDRNIFYDDLYKNITQSKASIVVSTADSYTESKRKRGAIVEVPAFGYPSTTDLYESYFQ